MVAVLSAHFAHKHYDLYFFKQQKKFFVLCMNHSHKYHYYVVQR